MTGTLPILAGAVPSGGVISAEAAIELMERMADCPNVIDLARLTDEAQPHGYHDRGRDVLAYLQMPGFAAHVRDLARGLAAQRRADPTADRHRLAIIDEAEQRFGADTVALRAGTSNEDARLEAARELLRHPPAEGGSPAPAPPPAPESREDWSLRLARQVAGPGVPVVVSRT